jgi:mediator of RNA polymerase II transcription subunit 18, fungi type
MYELCLSAMIEENDEHRAKAVFCGLCAIDQPWYDLHHVVFFRGPNEARPRGIFNTSSIHRFTTDKEVAMDWKDLHQNLTRQAYVIRTKYQVYQNVDFGAPVGDFNARPGKLHWMDFPEPPQGRPAITQRKKVEIWDQQNLHKVLNDNKYT